MPAYAAPVPAAAAGQSRFPFPRRDKDRRGRNSGKAISVIMNAKKLKETELVTKWAVQIEQKPITGKKASQNNRALINYKTGPIK